ncbi:hypothetical protein [Guptibacillus hwajinpoensis]|uniref:hypothetical protein n=1 Tax=Guptibacillus hwajinpoensis TaxID=208199 RepID=UPI001CFE8326|nr:hypothetical protein [Pseudalkalibacillus hwajinpoensis]WLR59092.1 hypothetical protein LC071_18370 [Pseudalkalibacillus hwajinpoensis]
MKRIHFFLLLSLVVLGGCVNSNSENYSEETIEKAKASVESYIINNYQNVESVEFKESPSAPMGRLVLEGTVNKKATLNIGVNDDFTVGSIGMGEGFPEPKEECKEHSCDYEVSK